MPITIGIPFYNAEAYLANAIRSVFAQSYQKWELILVDDGSADHSLDIARSVKDPRVRVISDGQNKRLPYRLNQIAGEAKFDFIGRMDADDLISPNRFGKQLEILQRHPEIDLVTTGVCSITTDNRPIGVRGGNPEDVISGRTLLLGQSAIVHAAILSRRAWSLRNPYDESINRTEDYELWLRAFSRSDFRIYVMSDQFYYYREEENVTPKRQLTAYASQRDLYQRYGYLGLGSHELPLIIAKSYLKSAVVYAFSVAGRMDLLLKRRNKAITDKAKLDNFTREIKQILETRVPGLD